MATTFVKCVSKEHALACRELGVLYLNFGSLWGWKLAEGLNTEWVRSVYGQSEREWPATADFGIALEE